MAVSSEKFSVVASHFHPVGAGATQGGILDPLPYLMFTSDIPVGSDTM